MLLIEVFGKTGCARCKSARDKLDHLIRKAGRADDVDLVYHDLETIDGLAEGAFNDVTTVPTTILRSEAGEVVARWDGRLPPSAEVNAYLGAGR